MTSLLCVYTRIALILSHVTMSLIRSVPNNMFTAAAERGFIRCPVWAGLFIRLFGMLERNHMWQMCGKHGEERGIRKIAAVLPTAVLWPCCCRPPRP